VTRAFLALGSNLGDRVAHLRGAVEGLPDVVALSPVFETEPVGGPDGQGPFLNMVVQLDTALGARDLLGWCHRLEEAAGRTRAVHWGPRTLDVDILWIDGVRIDEPDLHVPHPRLRERPFVLAPLATLAPDLAPAGWEAGFDHLGVWPLGHLHDLEEEAPVRRGGGETA
jgi:2-amino-4-hydroxy-6-hydroxymethyldihydropteridine diphosphokinase